MQKTQRDLLEDRPQHNSVSLFVVQSSAWLGVRRMKFSFSKTSLRMLAPIILFATLPGSYSSAANEGFLVSPPRSFDDVTAILDQQKRENPKKLAKA